MDLLVQLRWLESLDERSCQQMIKLKLYIDQDTNTLLFLLTDFLRKDIATRVICLFSSYFKRDSQKKFKKYAAGTVSFHIKVSSNMDKPLKAHACIFFPLTIYFKNMQDYRLCTEIRWDITPHTFVLVKKREKILISIK